MKPFKFTLQAVQTVRRRDEQRALDAYLVALRQLEAAKNRVQELDRQLEAAWAAFRAAVLDPAAAAADLARLHEYCDRLLRQRREADGALKAARAGATRTFARYLAAHLACLAVQECYVRQHRAYRRQTQRLEQKALDDLAQRSRRLIQALRQGQGTFWN
jgi:flagellar biosynthesis chaperone FliJ